MNINIRLATIDDAKVLFDWVNDPVVRNASFNPSPIQYDEHVTWLRGKLKDPNVFILIALSNEKPIGVVRFDKMGLQALVNITIYKTARSKGYGSQTLSAAISYALQADFCKEFIAYIKEQNIPSQNIFINNNFIQVNNTEADKYPGLKFLLVKSRTVCDNLAIIPARGGSKRIPRKNIRSFCGKPIIQYSIDAALESNCFTKVMVSTDDPEIAEIAIKCGAEVPFMRSEKNANDYATLADVLIEVIDEYEKRINLIENVCCILATAPLIVIKDLINSFNTFYKYRADSLVSITKFPYPVQRALKKVQDNVFMMWPTNIDKRSNDLEPAYHDAGQFYWLNVASFKKSKKIFSNNTTAWEIPQSRVQDIDNEEDWKISEMKYKILNITTGAI